MAVPTYPLFRSITTMMTIKAKRAVKPFRKHLRARLRAGTAVLRVFGSKGAWHLGIQVGETIHRYSNPDTPYMTMATAVMAGYRKFKVKAGQYKGKAAA